MGWVAVSVTIWTSTNIPISSTCPGSQATPSSKGRLHLPAVTKTEKSDSTMTLHMLSMSLSSASGLFIAGVRGRRRRRREGRGDKWH